MLRAALFVLATATGCHLLAGTDEFTDQPPGQGGSGGTAGAGGQAGGDGGGGPGGSGGQTGDQGGGARHGGG